MSAELICVIVLGLMFVIGTWRDINMGLLGFVAAAGVGGLVLHQAPEEFLAGFPVDLFLTLVGLTYLFGFAQNNGVIEVIVKWASSSSAVGLRSCRGSSSRSPRSSSPWVRSSPSPSSRRWRCHSHASIVYLRVDGRSPRRPRRAGGAFSPISVYGIFINDYLARNGLTPTPVSLFFAPLIFNVVFALVVYIVLRRRGPDLARRGARPVRQKCEFRYREF